MQEFLGDLYDWKNYSKFATAEDGSISELKHSIRTLHEDIAAWTSRRLARIQKEDSYHKHLEDCLTVAEKAFDKIETDFPGLSGLYSDEIVCFASVAETLDIAVATAIERAVRGGKTSPPDIQAEGFLTYWQAV